MAQPDCITCFGYALAESDVLQHEAQAGSSFDDWYEALTGMRDAHVERAHPGGAATDV
ncbi:hypothetical protein [Kitasatospora kifunensis]|uniref:Uncharacterized protein n=1 Tax=Kitasatospora kifunensis TaxID=58351 RepID=A0A7W7W0X4_KITKI|nr:hypothetical protein [Kitasatospora kifunensis]MBB4929100.1 hypothetical protein [Kitasatospora kifunensis]